MRSSAKLLVIVVVLAAFTLLLPVALGVSATFGSSQNAAQAESALRWIARAVGAFIAAVAALTMLVEGLDGQGAQRLSRMAFPLLAGLLLIEMHWSLALALGAVVLGVVVKEIVALFVGRSQQTEAEQQPCGRD